MSSWGAGLSRGRLCEGLVIGEGVMKKITCSHHAIEQMEERGATKNEVETAIAKGERVPAKRGRIAFRFNFQYNAK